MTVVDLNVVLYAINTAAVRHAEARTWWESALNGDEPVGLTWSVVTGFLRLSTHPSVLPRPLTVEQACQRVNKWLGQPTVRLVRETDEHWRHLEQLLLETGTGGNLTSDAHLAALAVSHGATLVSFDHDFARFANLRWVNPGRQGPQ
ncbi:MAG: type II toxin-antitoxin system VapC family toxin [Acidobacteria bacterium]|nr:type II toxin-antitoxin system VapC family toxin [Acidobacteriota bacterium]MXZ69924.1 type II toxin-antitoxin system VapC family toxin [Acidobacteriota bacterium]MYD72383.1 type II toxin-antitoxin system VapC family toxin [Acidobacteriota bacterium]MYJ06075.1 type II toxin-antitoxin system VapC family toxin [Acidobacteriota bacterium]